MFQPYTATNYNEYYLFKEDRTVQFRTVFIVDKFKDEIDVSKVQVSLERFHGKLKGKFLWRTVKNSEKNYNIFNARIVYSTLRKDDWITEHEEIKKNEN